MSNLSLSELDWSLTYHSEGEGGILYNIQISIFINVCCASTDVCVGFIIVL